MMEVHGFTQSGSIDVTMDGVRMLVPDNMENRQRQLVAEWEAEGNTIPLYVELEATTLTLTKRQVVAALILGAEILDPDAAVTTAIGTITDPLERALALNDWKNAPYYNREHPLFNSEELLTVMGMTIEEVDLLWSMAAVLPQ